jgi:hypothetical protein
MSDLRNRMIDLQEKMDRVLAAQKSGVMVSRRQTSEVLEEIKDFLLDVLPTIEQAKIKPERPSKSKIEVNKAEEHTV